MDDKNESEKLMEELKRIGEGFNKFIESIGEALNKLFYPKEDEWEMKCPYKIGDNYWIICDSGEFEKVIWNDYNLDKEVFIAGNAFPTKEEAELEAKRRNLLTRFRAFRDECNDGWKPNWRKNDAKYYFYISSTDGEIGINDIYFYETFPLFGYFKNSKDAQRAIELFGDEIKELFVDCEAQ
jgi:hypothetical protein|nr:MAG TPA: hypothetical protein [Caudoviricetes sp.]